MKVTSAFLTAVLPLSSSVVVGLPAALPAVNAVANTDTIAGLDIPLNGKDIPFPAQFPGDLGAPH